ncbi:hypothetical protein M422DRAFT_253848 [Sphaerobolus stellatus SS14]|uniref:Uncharacterized protein n=1 Tax=Sphaerobolus stellatus (strain SS14) TaxID=990650 RepID=A0A0C9V703_SPHS4|nr:hypothetical protein M422DRAFT_253848 [Sphaerobolus stellatus SS14]
MSLHPPTQRRSLDPLDAVTRPPSNESNPQQEERLAAERVAKEASDEIDAAINAAHHEGLECNPQALRILLLGPSGSGKSTLMKQFQRVYDTTFDAERIAWRYIIILNFIQCTRKVVDKLCNRAEPRKWNPSPKPPVPGEQGKVKFTIRAIHPSSRDNVNNLFREASATSEKSREQI